MMDQQSRNLQQEEMHKTFHGFSAEPPPGAPLVFPPITLEMLASLLDFSPDALLAVDPAGTIVLLNTQIEKLFEYGQEELVGQSLEMLLPERLRAGHTAQRLNYMNAPHARPMGVGLKLVGRRKDSSEFPVDISLRPIQVRRRLYVLAAVRDMTAQRSAEQERVQLTERLHQQDQLINLSHDAIVVHDAEGHITSWNRGAEDLYGWQEHEVIGQLTSNLLSTRFPQPLEDMLRSLEQEGHWDGELIHLCHDGREVIVDSRWALVRNEEGKPTAILEINRDITARRRLEHIEQEARAEIKARLDVSQLILDHLSTGIFLLQGPQARLLLANQAVTDLWGKEWKHGQPMEDFLASQQIRIFTEDGRPVTAENSALRHVMLSGEPVLHRQLVIRRSDGSSFPVMVDMIPLDLLHTFHRLPAEMEKLLDSSDRVILVVHQNVSVLKEAEALKDQFISLAAHELRTPVTVLAGYADLLLRQVAKGKGQELDEQQKSKIQAIQDAADRLTKLIEDLLDVTRVQMGQFQLQQRPTDVIELTRRIIDQIQTTTEHHRLTLVTSLDHLQATVDAFRLEQVLSNLLMNAIKYSPQGGPVEVSIWKDDKKDVAHFKVSDHGMGIPKEQQARIFGRFMRADNVRTARINGTGLGLYLCRELVERHGGAICFESDENLGSTFFFTLPCESFEEDKRLL